MLVFGPLLLAAASTPRNAPSYSVDQIVSSADFAPGWLAPNTIATVFGKGLSYSTRVLQASDIDSGTLPFTLPGTGVSVLIGGVFANIFYVSPTQINFLIPVILRAGPTDFQIVLDGLAGPIVPIVLQAAAPALFQINLTAIATQVDGSLVTSDAPAHAGDIISIYATGLGDATPPVMYSNVAMGAAPLKWMQEFSLLLGGAAIDPSFVLYAGLAPGFAGLYQINVRLPGGLDANPDLQIGLGNAVSPAGVKLPFSQ
jgi:uncharacterized protein (TIGR03437 family)